MMLILEWEKACIRKDGSAIDLADGRSARVVDEEQREFMENAGKNARVLIDGWRTEIYYNTETGDIYIPKYYQPAEADEIKKRFLRFISKDDHQDVDYKKVIIRM